MDKIDKYLQENPQHKPDKVAVVGYFIRDEKVLLIRRINDTKLGKNKIAGVGGKIDWLDKENRFETPEEALLREWGEEVVAKPIKYEPRGRVCFIHPDNPFYSMDVYVFVVTEVDNKPKSTKVARVLWCNVTEIPGDEMFRDNKYWVPQVVQNGKTVEGLFIFENREIVSMDLSFC